MKEAHVKGYMLHDSNYVKLWKEQMYGDTEMVSLPGNGQREGGIGGAQRIFRSVKLLCMEL